MGRKVKITETDPGDGFSSQSPFLPNGKPRKIKDHIAQEVHDHKERAELTRGLTPRARRCLFGGPR